MTTTRWLIVAFWAVMFLIGFAYFFQSVTAPAPTPVPEKHWFPASLPSSAPAAAGSADVRLLTYVMKQVPNTSTFTTDVTLKNFGLKKATAVQVRIQPYVGTMDTSSSAPGPDEIPSQQGGDPMASTAQWVAFADLGPGSSATQTLTFSMRGDADPAQSQPKAQVTFQAAP